MEGLLRTKGNLKVKVNTCPKASMSWRVRNTLRWTFIQGWIAYHTARWIGKKMGFMTGISCLRLGLNRNVGAYKILVTTYLDTGSSVSTAMYTITDAAHSIEVGLVAGAGTGSLELIIDDVSKETLSSLDNDTRCGVAGYALLGASSVSEGTSGSFYMDEIVIHNRNEVIGS